MATPGTSGLAGYLDMTFTLLPGKDQNHEGRVHRAVCVSGQDIWTSLAKKETRPCEGSMSTHVQIPLVPWTPDSHLQGGGSCMSLV